MSALKHPLEFETAFAIYTADEIIGEGGAGRVYSAESHDGVRVAIKLLSEERASREKRGRFKNEIAFLQRNKHINIVTVLDHGIIRIPAASGPFYVMRRFECNLRELIEAGIRADQVLRLFGQILDGVEAAHLQQVIHRDLKPENILANREGGALAIADFGVAQFSEDLLATHVETAPGHRLANFQYAAPEQRTKGGSISTSTDIYALGLMLNEMFTGAVPHGTDYKTVSSVAAEWSYIDELVARMIRQNPAERPTSIQHIKSEIEGYHSQYITLQKLSAFSEEIVPSLAIDDPLATEPPKLVGADWNAGELLLTLDQPVSKEWVDALGNMGSYSSVMGVGPETFRFHGRTARVRVNSRDVQAVIDHFKVWLPNATGVLHFQLRQHAQRAEAQRQERLRRMREAEEERLRVLRALKI